LSTEKVFEAKHTRRITEEKTEKTQTDIGAQLESIREMIPKIRNAITELRGAQVRIKDWTVTFGNVNDEYILDLSLKFFVKPQTEE
jgi:L-lysine 2,3-aminomutase